MNLAEIILGHPADAPAVVAPGRTLTYGRLREETAALRGGLARLGVGPGQRVLLALGNDWPFVVAYLAVVGLGAVAVPVDPTLPGPALGGEIDVVTPGAAVVGPEAVEGFRSAARRFSAVVAAPEAEGLPGAVGWEEALSGDPDTAPPVADCRPDEVALLVFTAGTAGFAKAAMLTHGSLRANLDQVQAHPGRALMPADVSYGVLPMFHVFGINVVLGLSLLAGASVLMVDRFHPDEALEQIAAHRVTLLAGAPPLFAGLASVPEARGEQLRSVRLAVSGASPLPEDVGRAFEERFGLPLWQGYGLTEASPVVTSSVVGGVVKPGSVGVPVPGEELRLVDEAGDDALVGDPGEIWVRGPNVFAGYWNDPEATAAVLDSEGWLHTGDVGVVDDDGFLYLVDRVKDLILVSGFNVYPAEVEAVLASHPGVGEAAVVGAPDPATGESVRAFVVGTASEEELSAWCAQRLAAYKRPSVIRRVDALPHGLAGKLLRQALRELV